MYRLFVQTANLATSFWNKVESLAWPIIKKKTSLFKLN